MDESVIFVQELRSRDSDVCVLESDETNQETSRRNPKRKVKNFSVPIPFVDLSRDSGNFENTASSNQSLNSIKPLNKESEKNNHETQAVTFECPVCLESMQNLEIRVTPCGHLFCKSCIDEIISRPRPPCPKCRKLIIKKHVRHVFL